MNDDKRLCPFGNVHGEHCVKIEHLEDNIIELRNAVKDARKSLNYDMEKLSGDIKEHHVSKDEFDPVKKLVYGVILVILADVIRRAFF